MQLLFDVLTEAQVVEEYIKDNVDATETLIDAMVAESVPYLIYGGDAYANLEAEDNFGLSEDNHPGIPKNFLLGDYGETRIRAELYARKHVGTTLANGEAKLKGVFLRPVFVYGEGERQVTTALLASAKRNDGFVPTFAGASRSMFQYIYAGNYANLLIQSMNQLITAPQKCDGEYVYCMEDTVSSRFNEFYEPILKAAGASFTPPENSYYVAWLKSFTGQWLARLGLTDSTSNDDKSGSDLTTIAMRFFLGYAYGFANRKQKLTIPWNPVVSTAEAVKRTVKWTRATFQTRSNVRKIEPKVQLVLPTKKTEDEYGLSKLDRFDGIGRKDQVLRMG
uniref:3Beta_HSD domain-containing protein n=1 Tax=Panagrellus redivivus TaxID=6233 RepID=A0A7E4ZY37_PANRE